MCSKGLSDRRVGYRDEVFVVGLSIDTMGTIVTIEARGLITGFPVPLVVVWVFPSMNVLLIFNVPGVLSACAVQDGGCVCWMMGTLLSERRHQ